VLNITARDVRIQKLWICVSCGFWSDQQPHPWPQ